jgi:hypothetical protein
MPRNGAGTFTVLNPVQIGQLRSSSQVNANFTDAGDELTNSVPLDGSADMTGQFKPISGTAPSPGISWVVDPNTGFRLVGADEMTWVAGAQDRATMDANGKLTLRNGLEVTGSVNLSSVLKPQLLFGNGQTLLTLGREENDTSEHRIMSYQSGSGSGVDGSLRIVGTGSNAVSTARYYVDTVKVLGFSSTLTATDADVQTGGVELRVGGNIRFTAPSAIPSVPAVNVARLFSFVNGVFYRDSAGITSQIDTPAVERQIFTANGTWNKPVDGQTTVLIEMWGGGGGGGGGTSSDGGGSGGGGGAYSRRVMSIASVSAAVSVAVGGAGIGSGNANRLGTAGGDSSFGTYLSAYGGGGGSAGFNDVSHGGGGGGGLLSAGDTQPYNTPLSTVRGGLPRGDLGNTEWGGTGGTFGTDRNSNPFGGGAGPVTSTSTRAGLWGGAGGGTGGNFDAIGSDAVYGGAGGGGIDDAGATRAGGSSVYGGNGGASGVNGVAGGVPGGGGGACGSTPLAGTGGDGGRGEVRITCW